MAETPQDDTFTLVIDGHDFVFNKLPGQQLTMWRMYLTMWQKQFKQMDTDSQRQEALDSLVARALNVAQDKLVSDEDKALIVDKLLMNRYEYMELFAVFRNGVNVDTQADDDDPKPVAKKAAIRKAPAKARVKR